MTPTDTPRPPGRGATDPSRLDEVVAAARRAREAREQGYREQALKLYPWVCGRCSRHFTRTNLRELTEELKLQLERVGIYGVQHGSTPLGSDSVARTMNGIKYYINRSGGNVISSGFTAPNEDLINAMCRMFVQKNGQFDNRPSRWTR